MGEESGDGKEEGGGEVDGDLEVGVEGGGSTRRFLRHNSVRLIAIAKTSEW